MTAPCPHDSRTFKCLASSATERKGKSRGDSPTFYKMWEADSGDYRRRHTALSQKRERVIAEAKKEVRNGTVPHAHRFAGSHIL